MRLDEILSPVKLMARCAKQIADIAAEAKGSKPKPSTQESLERFEEALDLGKEAVDMLKEERLESISRKAKEVESEQEREIGGGNT